MPIQQPRYFEALDGLRGIAALVVLLDHATCLAAGFDLFARNILAVQFFFMLSGFVVACAYEARIRAGFSFGAFCVRRVIRLYPLIFVGAVAGALALAVSDPSFPGDPLAGAAVMLATLGLPTPHTGFSFGYFPVNPPEWSLFFELLANLAFGLLLSRWPSRAVAVVAACGFAVYAGIGFSFWPGEIPFWAETFGMTASFSIGMLIWRCHQRQSLPVLRLPFSLLALMLVGLCAMPARWGLSVNFAAIALAFPALITAGMAQACSPGRRRVMHLLGELSYPLYVLHWPVLLLARLMLPELGQALTMAIGAVVALAVGWVALVTVDRPARRWLLARVSRSARPSVSTGPFSLTRG